MYEFCNVIKVLPMEYRRKLSYSISILFRFYQDEGEGEYEPHFQQVANMYQAVKQYEMMALEGMGMTNTSINPFETGLTPPY